MMKLTTPATASAPYTDEAPPVSTSTRLTSAEGMKLMSATGDARIARLQPAAVDQHQRAGRAEAAQIDRRGAGRAVGNVRALAANDCGSELIRSSVRVVPWSLMSWLDSTVTGLAEVRFGCGMREPVMTMSPPLDTGAPWALVDGGVVASTGAVVSGCAPFAVSAGLAGGGAVCAVAGAASRPVPTRSVVASRRERT